MGDTVSSVIFESASGVYPDAYSCCFTAQWVGSNAETVGEGRNLGLFALAEALAGEGVGSKFYWAEEPDHDWRLGGQRSWDLTVEKEVE